MTRTWTVAAVAALGLLGACGPKPETAARVTTAPDGTVNYTVKGPDGASAVVSSGASAAANLPSHVPVYPGAQVDASIVGTGGLGGTLTFRTTAKPAEVVDFYKQKAAQAGLAEALNSQSPGGMMFSATKDGGQTALNVIAAPSDTQTSVQVTWNQAAKAG